MPTIEQSRQRAKDERLQAHRIDDTSFIVYNIEKGSRYVVSVAANGYYHCTCPYMTKGSRLQSGTCKHIQRVKDKTAPCTGCQRPHEDTFREGKCTECRAYERVLGN